MRISDILVHQQGPLKKNFNLEAKGMNLIYGPNESGKTFIIEALMQWLFPKNSKINKKVRLWSPSPTGWVKIIGLPSNPQTEHIVEPSASSDLASLFHGVQSSKTDLSELLVVHAGDTLLSSPDTLVQEKLSGQAMLKMVLDKIKPKTRKASISKNIIHGVLGPGLYKDFKEAKEKLQIIRELKEEYEQEQGVRLDGLDSKVLKLERRKGQMKEAKRYLAFVTAKQISALEEDIKKLPSHSELIEFSDKARRLLECRRAVQNILSEKKEKGRELEHENWLRKGLDKNKNSEKVRNIGVFIGAAVGFSLGIIDIFDVVPRDFPDWLPWVTIIFAVFIVGVFYLVFGRIPQKQKKDYLEKFGEPLENMLTLDAKIRDLDELKGEFKKLDTQINENRNRILEFEKKLYPVINNLSIDSNKEEWPSCLDELINNRTQYDNELTLQKERLKNLAVQQEEYLETDPGIAWSAEQENFIVREHRKAVQNFDSAAEKGDGLKKRIGSIVGELSMDWENLIGKLESSFEEAEESYKNITAELIGQIYINEAIHDLQVQENHFISENLSDPLISQDLQKVGDGRFREFSWKDGKLKIVTEGKRMNNISELSTGANEQIMLALRTIFAGQYLDNTQGFFLLDDAFQHSDYKRRESIVDYMIQLVKDRGWQIFYFSMDDHLANLIHERSKLSLKNDYAFYRLA